MQHRYAPNTFRAEVAAWRTVIYLNLVRSVNFIFDRLSIVELHNSDPTFNLLKTRLLPLRKVEQILCSKLCGSPGHDQRMYRPDRASEVRVKSGSGWKALLNMKQPPSPHLLMSGELCDAQELIFQCREDIIKLWKCPSVQESLNEMGIVLQEQPGLCGSCSPSTRCNID